MSDNTNQPKRPSHIAYQVRDTGEGKSYFNRIGSAFAHGDGKGFNLMLNSVPVDGRVTLRTPQERINELGENKQPDRERKPRGRGW